MSLTITERWEQGVPHDPRSIALYKSIADIDSKEGGDVFDFKSGGDGDSGEHLMYLFDIHFERKDKTIVIIQGDASDGELRQNIQNIEKIK